MSITGLSIVLTPLQSIYHIVQNDINGHEGDSCRMTGEGETFLKDVNLKPIFDISSCGLMPLDILTT